MINNADIIFSIIIAVSRPQELCALLQNLAKQTFDRESFEVIAVYSDIHMTFPNVPFSLQTIYSENMHASVKKNKGVRLARGKYYAFLDDDCTPPIMWLNEGFNLLQEHTIVSGPCHASEKDRLSQRISRAVMSSFLGSGSNMFGTYKETPVAFYNVPFCNVFMHKSVWELIGGCNEKAHMQMDDKEFFFLASLGGLQFYNSRKVEVSHSSRSFPLEFLTESFKEKVCTGINVFVYNEIFRRQPIFYVIYASYLLVPLLVWWSWKAALLLLCCYVCLSAIMNVRYIRQDWKVYICLPVAAIVTIITMLCGVLLGSLYYGFNKTKFREEITLKKERISRVLTHA